MLFHCSSSFLLYWKLLLKPNCKWAISVYKTQKRDTIKEKLKRIQTLTPKFLIYSTSDLPDITSILQFWTEERMEVLKLQRSLGSIKETCASPCATVPWRGIQIVWACFFYLLSKVCALSCYWNTRDVCCSSDNLLLHLKTQLITNVIIYHDCPIVWKHWKDYEQYQTSNFFFFNTYLYLHWTPG